MPLSPATAVSQTSCVIKHGQMDLLPYDVFHGCRGRHRAHVRSWKEPPRGQTKQRHGWYEADVYQPGRTRLGSNMRVAIAEVHPIQPVLVGKKAP